MKIGLPCGSGFVRAVKGYLECRWVGSVDEGDHVIVVAKVVEAEFGPLEGPLLLASTGWNYGG